jgi:hypothetical protein
VSDEAIYYIGKRQEQQYQEWLDGQRKSEDHDPTLLKPKLEDTPNHMARGRNCKSSNRIRNLRLRQQMPFLKKKRNTERSGSRGRAWIKIN